MKDTPTGMDKLSNGDANNNERKVLNGLNHGRGESLSYKDQIIKSGILRMLPVVALEQ